MAEFDDQGRSAVEKIYLPVRKYIQFSDGDCWKIEICGGCKVFRDIPDLKTSNPYVSKIINRYFLVKMEIYVGSFSCKCDMKVRGNIRAERKDSKLVFHGKESHVLSERAQNCEAVPK